MANAGCRFDSVRSWTCGLRKSPAAALRAHHLNRMAGLELPSVTEVAQPPGEAGPGQPKPARSFLFLASALASGNVVSSLLRAAGGDPPGPLRRPCRPRPVQQHRPGPGIRAVPATWRLERPEPGTAVLRRQRRLRAREGTCHGGPGLGPGPERGAARRRCSRRYGFSHTATSTLPPAGRPMQSPCSSYSTRPRTFR